MSAPVMPVHPAALELRAFPARAGRLLVPVSSRAAALAALATYPACRPVAVAGQRMARGVVRLLGPRALPGGERRWTPPVPRADWTRMGEEWEAAVGPFDAAAVLRRSAGDGLGFGLLLLDRGEPVTFVKVRPEPATIRSERGALDTLAVHPPRTFSAPAVLGSGAVGDWSWLALEPLPARIHRPAPEADLAVIAAEAGAALTGLERPSGTPESWRPMHGDLTPWNLRRVGGRVWLLDWESAGWGPPGADLVLWQAAAAALRGGRGRPSPFGEAVAFWRSMVSGRGTASRDRRLAEAMDRALAGMAREVL